jgi:glutathione S-transferase
MSNLTLYIGNKNYSSWSMRAWMALKFANIDFKEEKIELFSDEVSKISPSGKVPCLYDDKLKIWDTVAIIEYLNEKFPKKNFYPEDSALRSTARSCIAEMHSGFLNLRSECPMNIKRNKAKNISADAKNDLNRIYQIWDFCKELSGSNKFLLGEFSVIDAFFAPIISRIISYRLKQYKYEEYINKIFNHKYFQEWQNDAIKETSIIKCLEVV